MIFEYGKLRLFSLIRLSRDHELIIALSRNKKLVVLWWDNQPVIMSKHGCFLLLMFIRGQDYHDSMHRWQLIYGENVRSRKTFYWSTHQTVLKSYLLIFFLYFSRSSGCSILDSNTSATLSWLLYVRLLFHTARWLPNIQNGPLKYFQLFTLFIKYVTALYMAWVDQ